MRVNSRFEIRRSFDRSSRDQELINRSLGDQEIVEFPGFMETLPARLVGSAIASSLFL